MISYVKTANTLEVILNGKPFSVHSSHSNFQTVLDALRKKDEVALGAALDTGKEIAVGTNGNVSVVDGQVLFRGSEIHGTFVDRLKELLDLRLDINPIVAFIDNIMQNPTKHVLDDLYTFLEVGKLPLTTDGHFLAYKVVTADYRDKHSGRFDNSVGLVLKMNRNQVDDNRNNTCSNGFHFCSFDYIRSFYSEGDRIVLVKVNPKDVVSIPTDHGQTKARCCEYLVVEDVTDKMKGACKETQCLNTPLNTDYDVSDADGGDEHVEVDENAPSAFASIGDREDVDSDQAECDHCGSTDLQSRGTEKRAGGRTVRRLNCNDCGKNTYIEE